LIKIYPLERELEPVEEEEEREWLYGVRRRTKTSKTRFRPFG